MKNDNEEGKREERRGVVRRSNDAVLRPPSAVVDHKATVENGIKSDKRI